MEALPAIENGILYVGSENGHFYAIGTPGEAAKKPFEIIAPAKVTAGLAAVFATNITTAANTYKWDFGDGSTRSSTGPIGKIWTNPGTYVVTASIGDNNKTVTVNIVNAPGNFTGGQSQKATIENGNGVTIPEINALTLRFSNSTVESGNTPKVTISDYKAVNAADASITLAEQFTNPPNTEKVIFRMNVSAVENIKEKGSLSNYAWLTVKLPATDADKEKLSFWRYADGDKARERLKFEYGSYSGGMAEYNVYIPGFSTIVATVDKTTVPIVNPPTGNTGGGGGAGGGSASGIPDSITFTNINPGTGTISYTTNHPDWPATTITLETA